VGEPEVHVDERHAEREDPERVFRPPEGRSEDRLDERPTREQEHGAHRETDPEERQRDAALEAPGRRYLIRVGPNEARKGDGEHDGR